MAPMVANNVNDYKSHHIDTERKTAVLRTAGSAVSEMGFIIMTPQAVTRGLRVFL